MPNYANCGICEVCEVEQPLNHKVAFEDLPDNPFRICDGCFQDRPDGVREVTESNYWMEAECESN